MQYRPEIDGLRALAVIPVILFHGGFAGFSGGFVGVDVFFVISGFLITGILIEDLERGQFSLVTFYERRARRILPALFFVVFACIPFAWGFFAPRDLASFADSVVYTTTFLSNIHFWQETDYFNDSAELSPLLHTWSLAVEEQFYIVFPPMLWGLWRFGPRYVFLPLCFVLLLSLGLAEWSTTHAPVAGYYLLPMRAWELLIGSLAALAVHRGLIRFPPIVEEGLGAIGILLIGYSVIAYDEQTPFPGLPALVPTIGTLLILLPTRAPTLIHRGLALPGVVAVGLVSYSAYLWHQPLFAFARYRFIEDPPVVVMWGLVLATFGLAYLSWRLVEAPFRNRNQVSRKTVFVGSAAAGTVLCGFGMLGIAHDGFPSRIDMPVTIEASIERSDRQSECFAVPRLHEVDNWTCTLGDSNQRPQFMVFGDSHVLSLLDAFDTAAKTSGVSGELSGAAGCTPFLEVFALRRDQKEFDCHAANLRLLRYVQQRKIQHVILIARWTYYTDGGYTGDDFSYIARTPDGPRSVPENRATFENGLSATLDAYAEAGIDLTLIAQVPQQVVAPLQAYTRAYVSWSDPSDTIARFSVTRDRHNALQAFVGTVFDRFDAPVLDLTDQLCEGQICPLGTSETSYYFDDDHLSLKGADRLVPALVDLIQGVAAEGGPANE